MVADPPRTSSTHLLNPLLCQPLTYHWQSIGTIHVISKYFWIKDGGVALLYYNTVSEVQKESNSHVKLIFLW